MWYEMNETRHKLAGKVRRWMTHMRWEDGKKEGIIDLSSILESRISITDPHGFCGLTCSVCDYLT